jgi:hypothetical protein
MFYGAALRQEAVCSSAIPQALVVVTRPLLRQTDDDVYSPKSSIAGKSGERVALRLTRALPGDPLNKFAKRRHLEVTKRRGT